MNDEPNILVEVVRSIVANTIIVAAMWGGAGGLTSALLIDDGSGRVRAALRQIVLGALAAAGGGTTLGALLAHWLDLPATAIPAFGTGGAMAYMTGIFGPAVMEVVLTRIRAGRLPADGDRDV